MSNDRKQIGHVDGLDDKYLIIKDGLIDPDYYKIPREKVDSYQDGKVVLNVSEQDAKERFKREYPGYFKDVQS
ncbi:MAG: hypothetical protein ACRD8W_08105 [Nitrososphaeraceae archaeon]